MVQLLRMAQHNEFEEFDPVYPAFAGIAKKEGFAPIANSFDWIAGIEKTHGNRFGKLADLLEQDRLFLSDVECGWMCLNCGYVFTGKGAPEKCPVCDHDRGYFIRLTMGPGRLTSGSRVHHSHICGTVVCSTGVLFLYSIWEIVAHFLEYDPENGVP